MVMLRPEKCGICSQSLDVDVLTAREMGDMESIATCAILLQPTTALILNMHWRRKHTCSDCQGKVPFLAEDGCLQIFRCCPNVYGETYEKFRKMV